VIRCNRDNPDNLEILPIFGPKVFATRFAFEDIALEARCLTINMEETDRDDIPPLLGDTFQKRAMDMRNKLLMWRLRNFTKINPNAVEEIDLGKIEPRLKQLGLPYAVPFKDYPEVIDRFRTFLKNYSLELKKDRMDSTNGKVITAIFRLAMTGGTQYVSSATISHYLTEEMKVELKPGAVGKVLKSLHVTTSQRRAPEGRSRYINWEDRLMRKLLRRYMPEPEEFAELFSENSDKPKIDMDV